LPKKVAGDDGDREPAMSREVAQGRELGLPQTDVLGSAACGQFSLFGYYSMSG
jgi:hypothetical protein